MALDYHERKQVQASKNRPKSRPFRFIILFVLGIVLGIYSLGVATGWFLHRATAMNPSAGTAPVAVQPTRNTKGSSSRSNDHRDQASNPAGNNEPSLTFYYTLPKGEKSALGSGLNPPKPGEPGKPPVTVSAGQTHMQVKQPRSNPADKENMSGGESKSRTPDQTEAAKRKYTVQVAAYSIRKDAEAVMSSLNEKGLPARIVESRVPGKGTWYRVRIGGGLSLEAAGGLASKAGTGAIIVPE